MSNSKGFIDLVAKASLSSFTKRNTGLFRIANRSINTNAISRAKIPMSLSKVLGKELENEFTKNIVNEDLEQIKRRIMKNFSLQDIVGTNHVKLTHYTETSIVTVTFDCQDESDGSIDEEKYENDMKNLVNEERDDFGGAYDQFGYGINFTVSIRKKSGGDELRWLCTAESESIKVKYIHKVCDHSHYCGPPFDILPSALKLSLLDFLKQHKVDADLCRFILIYAQFKEQKEFVNWLLKLEAF